MEVEGDATYLGTEETETEGIEAEIGTATGIGGGPTQGTEIETETIAGEHSAVVRQPNCVATVDTLHNSFCRLHVSD